MNNAFACPIWLRVSCPRWREGRAAHNRGLDRRLRQRFSGAASAVPQARHVGRQGLSEGAYDRGLQPYRGQTQTASSAMTGY